MKNKILILALALGLLLSNESFSQVQVAIGLKAGANFSNIDGSKSVADNYKGKAGFHGGAFVLFKIAKIGIQPEVLFSKQGSTYKVDTENYEANYDYINVPVIIKIYLPVGLNFQVGPQFGFLTGGDVEAFSTSSSAKTTYAAKDLYDGADLSVAVGLGWDLPFGLTIDGRYNFGVKSNTNGDATAEAPDFKNQVIQLSVGYKIFKFGK